MIKLVRGSADGQDVHTEEDVFDEHCPCFPLARFPVCRLSRKWVQNPDFPVVLRCAARQSRRTAKSGIKKNQWVRISMRNRQRAKTGGFAGFSLARVREVQKLPVLGR
jgi:hypothetical protein